jgi:uncharacterized protein (TIGR00290 family)
MLRTDEREPPGPAPAGGGTGRPRAVVSWSSGKDSAFALWEFSRRSEAEVVGLLTTVTGSFRRVSIHGVRDELLDRQAAALGLPIHRVEIPYPCPNEVYEEAMRRSVGGLRAAGVSQMVFGDLFLTDVREYREARLAGTGLVPVFPLWGRDTAALAREMITAGIEAYVVCLDPRAMPRELAGRRFDASLLDDLPASVDPCGERGEFHTFVANGPMFAAPIAVRSGEVVERDGFVFADLVPA